MNDKKKHTIFTVTITDKETGEIVQSFDTDAIVATVHNCKDLDDGIYSMIITNCTGEVTANLLRGIDKTKKRFEQSSVPRTMKDLLDHLKRFIYDE